MNRKNIFDLADISDFTDEIFENLHDTEDFRIERIISRGHTTPEGQWYDQDTGEWVLLLQGEAIIAFDGGEEQRLSAGDYLLIPARQRHRVTYTSEEPVCLWLAMHFRKA